MYKYFNMAAVILAAQILFSCSEKEWGAGDLDQGRIVARIDGHSSSRTAVGDAVGESNSVGIVWTDGDEIGVFDASGTSQKCYAKVGQGTQATATFAASGTTAFDNPVYAYYPYDEANASEDVTSLNGSLPTTQHMDDGKLHGDYKYGRATTPTADGGYEFVFEHIFSLARISIDASNTPLKNEVLKSLTVSVSREGVGVPIAGDFKFSAKDGSWKQTDEGKSSITLVWDMEAPTLDQVQTCYMNLFPLVEWGDLFTFTVLTENYKAEFTAKSLTKFYPEQIYNFPMVLDNYETIKVYDQDGTVVQGKFTCAALNVDGLPQLINSEGPGSEGTQTLGNIMNGLGYDFIAVSEDFEYHNDLVSGMNNYNIGTYRGSVSLVGKNDTDGLGFFWKKDGVTATGETMVEFEDAYGGLFEGANESIAKGFRHYVVTVAAGVEVDVYITHMNTYSGDGNTEENKWVHAQLSQLRQLRDYVVEQAQTNKRPAIIMGDTNMRYTRHEIVTNLINPVIDKGLQIADPWVEFHRGGVYPAWNTKSLMICSKFEGDPNDILCTDDQRGEVVDKMWYINMPDATVQLKATSCMNDVEHFTKSTEQVSFTGATVEDLSGNILPNQDVSYTKANGYADHFPVVVSFKYTYTNRNTTVK